MYPVLIGSRALAHWNKDFKVKDTADWDIISYQNHEGCEVHSPDLLNNLEMCEYSSSDLVTLPDGTRAEVMTMLGLAILKRSHLHRDIHFDRHITMYHKFGLVKSLNNGLNSADIVKEDLKKRIELTKKEFPQRTPKLNMSKQDFFDDYVTKKYDHDYLHELVAFYEKPLYTRLLASGKEVWCEESKWLELSHKEKVKCVAEEALVIAIERFMIPYEWDYISKVAFMKSLNKVCTTLCSGWFRDFAIDNYPEIVLQYDGEIFTKVKTILKG